MMPLNSVRLPVLVAVALTLFAAEARAGTTRLVPSVYATIQDAVNAAASGDTVMIASGQFYQGPGNRDIDLGAKNLVIRSDGQSFHPVLDCNRQGGGFIISGGQTSECTITGLTITNPILGILIENSSPTISGCYVYWSQAEGVLCDHADPTIISSQVREGHSYGMRCASSNPSVSLSTFSFNDDSGVHLVSSSPTFTECTFIGNTTPSSGGAVHLDQGSLVMTECTIAGNSAAQGGAIGMVGGTTNLNSSQVTGNQATDAIGGGGAIWMGSGGLSVSGCTIARNDASAGGGIYNEGGILLVACTILWGNCTSDLPANDVWVAPAGQASLSCCDVDPDGIHSDGGMVYTDQVFSDDPLFCDMGPCWSAPTYEGDFSVAGAS
ncbi:MAG: right-handed parallel beta-helix repeat-containing protein, partial [Candidatus Eisenbacteria bacterium]